MSPWRDTFATVAVPAAIVLNFVLDPGCDSPLEEFVGDYGGKTEEDEPENDP